MKGFPKNPELEAAVIANPNDTDAWAVYADWLQSQGDPRGELIALEQAQDASPETATDENKHRQKRIQELYNENQERWAPERPLFNGEPRTEFTKGEWKHGFLNSLELCLDGPDYPSPTYNYPQGYFNEDERREYTFAQVEKIQKILKPSTTKFLQELEARLEGEQLYIIDWLEGIRKQLNLKALRKIYFNFLVDNLDQDLAPEPEWERNGRIIRQITQLLETIPALRSVQLFSCFFPTEPPPAPLNHLNLKELNISHYLACIPALRFPGQASLPALERLRIDLDSISENEGEPEIWRAFQELFENQGLPRLKELEFRISPDNILIKFIKSFINTPLLKQLTQLTIDGNDITDRTALEFLKHGEYYRHLNQIAIKTKEISVELQSEIQKKLQPRTRVIFE